TPDCRRQQYSISAFSASSAARDVERTQSETFVQLAHQSFFAASLTAEAAWESPSPGPRWCSGAGGWSGDASQWGRWSSRWIATPAGRRTKGRFDFGLRIASTWSRSYLTSGTAPRMLFTKYARTTAISISYVGKRRR